MAATIRSSIPASDFADAGEGDHRRQGLPVVYDSVGKDTFLQSLDCLRPRGLMVIFGNASGPSPRSSINLLAQKGSLYLTRPTLGTYIATRADLKTTADDLFDVVASGKVKIAINQTYPLKDAAQAHRDLEAARRPARPFLRSDPIKTAAQSNVPPFLFKPARSDQVFIASKNSSLVFDCLSLSSRNSMRVDRAHRHEDAAQHPHLRTACPCRPAALPCGCRTW